MTLIGSPVEFTVAFSSSKDLQIRQLISMGMTPRTALFYKDGKTTVGVVHAEALLDGEIFIQDLLQADGIHSRHDFV
jgi:hypothetical protein